MTFPTLPTTALFCSVVMLAACGGGGGGALGGGGGGAAPPPDFGALSSEFSEIEGRLAARSNTAFLPGEFIEGIPGEGEARFTGIFFLDLDTTGATTELYGPATVTADFGASSLSGSASGFAGRDSSGAVAPYSGSVAFADGTVGAPVPNDFTLGYDGNLFGNGERVLFSGTLDGKFKGDPIRGILGRDDAPVASIDGVAVGGTAQIAAERVR